MTMMKLSSPAFENHEALPDRYTQDYENLSPPLQWSGQPEGTQELAISCTDPDAPSGTYVHWIVAGIDPQLGDCDEGKPPIGACEGITSAGGTGYLGPRPPRGDSPHRYLFHVHALNAHLDLADGFGYEELQRHLAVHEIASATLVGLYQRP